MLRKINIINYRTINVLLIFSFLIPAVAINAQTDKKYIRKGNREYSKNDFSGSEVSYRKAIDKNKQSPDAVFNVGDALYKQNKYEEAGKQFIENINLNDNRDRKSAGLYNLGNSLLKANKVKESIEAYKGSLKLQPENNEAKYNLAYAQDLLKQQEEQKKKDQDKDNKKEDQNKDNKDKKDQNQDKKDQNQDKKDQNQDKKDADNNQQDDKNKNQDQNNQTQQQQGISKEDAQRLLNAIENDEKNVQEKVKLAKVAKTKVRTVKNW
jgi:Ca-activated chloride channel family protein